MAREQSEVAAPLVFAGFGISAPELGYDDYKGIDAKGKIVVLFDQAPDIFGNNERAYFSSRERKVSGGRKKRCRWCDHTEHEQAYFLECYCQA